MMFDELERRDIGALVGIVVVSLALAAFFNTVNNQEIWGMIEGISTVVLGIAMLTSVLLIYLSVNLYGGIVGRAFTLMAIGFLLTIVRVPYIIWHFKGRNTTPYELGPALLDIPAGFWGGFLHTLMNLGIVFIIYGFYILWTSQEDAL